MADPGATSATTTTSSSSHVCARARAGGLGQLRIAADPERVASAGTFQFDDEQRSFVDLILANEKEVRTNPLPLFGGGRSQ
jgi:hypothetical protein